MGTRAIGPLRAEADSPSRASEDRVQPGLMGLSGTRVAALAPTPRSFPAL